MRTDNKSNGRFGGIKVFAGTLGTSEMLTELSIVVAITNTLSISINMSAMVTNLDFTTVSFVMMATITDIVSTIGDEGTTILTIIRRSWSWVRWTWRRTVASVTNETVDTLPNVSIVIQTINLHKVFTRLETHVWTNKRVGITSITRGNNQRSILLTVVGTFEGNGRDGLEQDNINIDIFWSITIF